MKPMNFTCLLRLSKSQLQENGFKDMVIDTIYGLLIEYLSIHSHNLAFPDLTLLCTQHVSKSACVYFMFIMGIRCIENHRVWNCCYSVRTTRRNLKF